MLFPFVRYEREGEVFRLDAFVTFGQCDAAGHLRVSELMTMLTDAAGEDFAQRGMSYEQLMERDIAFLLSRLSIRFVGEIRDRMPIVVRTWENGSRGSQFVRSFSVSDQNNVPLVHALSSWTTVVPSTRRIVRPSVLGFEGRNITDRTADALPPEKLRAPDVLAPLGEHRVVWSDLDRNGHVNNARYAAVVYDALPSDEQARALKDIRFGFSHEAVPGDIIALASAPLPGGRFVAGTTARGDCFQCELWFQ